jgi:NAD(P)H-hydrate epimerase
LLVGPGLGLEDTTKGFMAGLLSGDFTTGGSMGLISQQINDNKKVESSLPPTVVDADGLKLLAQIEGWPNLLPSPAVLTPHPGEMAILTGESKESIQENRIEIAERYSKEWGHVVVLKGAFTLIASPDGQTALIPVATPALARAGTGDVLAGMIAGLLAQGLDPYTSAYAGAWLHANTGLSLAERLGSTMSTMAGDLLDEIPRVLGRLK